MSVNTSSECGDRLQSHYKCEHPHIHDSFPLFYLRNLFIHLLSRFSPSRIIVLFSNSKHIKEHHFLTSPRLPSFLRLAKSSVTCAPVIMSPPCKYTRQCYSRESSYDSTISTISPTSETSPQAPNTIHHRRTISRLNSSRAPPSLVGFHELFHSRVSTPLVSPVPSDESDSSDAKRWQRMLRMQKEFHCYKSARLEAAVEALERGEDPPIRECPYHPHAKRL